jgi:uncharacterized protein YdeI (YjbR/CyaY-like superfamily)
MAKSAKSPQPELPTLAFASAKEWEAWLERHHATAPGVWIKLAKKGSGIPSVTYMEAVDVGLCYGWIDSQSKSLDDRQYVQRFTPRRARSPWSKINRAKAEEFIAQGKMRPAGMREVEAAQADGRWEAAYDGQRTIEVPPDLKKLLDRNAKAKRFFATLDSKNRYAVLHRIQQAKKPETRARRIEQFVAMLAEGKKIY